MTKTIKLNGAAYPISDQFAAALSSLGELDFSTARVDGEITALLRQSELRQLKPHEYARLNNLTHVKNVGNAIRVVGAHHDPIEEFGFDGWDAVHGQGTTFECGCQTHEVVDHHAFFNHFGHDRATGESPRHLVEPRRVCVSHVHLRDDPKEHHAQVVKDHAASIVAE